MPQGRHNVLVKKNGCITDIVSLTFQPLFSIGVKQGGKNITLYLYNLKPLLKQYISCRGYFGVKKFLKREMIMEQTGGLREHFQ